MAFTAAVYAAGSLLARMLWRQGDLAGLFVVAKEHAKGGVQLLEHRAREAKRLTCDGIKVGASEGARGSGEAQLELLAECCDFAACSNRD